MSSDTTSNHAQSAQSTNLHKTRSYQQEMLEASLRSNIIIAMDTGSGKTHIAVLRLKIESEREQRKVSWFLCPTVNLCEQQRDVIANALPLSVGLISGSLEPDQWKDPNLWAKALASHRIIVTTPQVLLDALRHGYVNLGRDIGLIVFDEAHHAADRHPYNQIMREFYDTYPPRTGYDSARDKHIVRPFILGLTASPIFGGSARDAFKTIERNLDASIVAPRLNRDELARHVHRPEFKHIVYTSIDHREAPKRSLNTVALARVVDSLNIHDDPSVHSLQDRLRKLSSISDDYKRLDQKLSKLIDKKDSFTHKGLRDFLRTSKELSSEVGPWAADWFVQAVVERALNHSSPSHIFFGERHALERAYLLDQLKRIDVTPVSYEPGAVMAGMSPKAKKLIICLLDEKATRELQDEFYSGLVFVTRRDAVLALAELLSHHPFTKDRFKIGTLLGKSDSTRRNSFLDITRTLVKQSQSATLGEFRIGEKNLLISTAVAEEGIDIQACGCVIRWDIPQNMVSWAQSRGRARRKKSTFILMFEDGGVHDGTVKKWNALEKEMVSLYLDEQRLAALFNDDDEDPEDPDLDDENVEFRVEKTGATVTLNSAISHLTHFCAVLPNTTHVDIFPIYDVTPPDYPIGYHSAPPGTVRYPNNGPFGATVVLPRLLPPDQREHSVQEKYATRTKAKKHAAFKAYVSLYRGGLLNDYLLPFDGIVERNLGAEVKELLKKIEKREGFARVSNQINPWEHSTAFVIPGAQHADWFVSAITVDGIIATFAMLTWVEIPVLDFEDILYDPERGQRKFRAKPVGWRKLSHEQVLFARRYTRRLFSLFYGTRMNWDNMGFSYLFLPSNEGAEKSRLWEERRLWAQELESRSDGEGVRNKSSNLRMICNAATYGAELAYPDDISVVLDTSSSHRFFRFRMWRKDVLSDEERDATLLRYKRIADVQITYPVIVATPLPKRMNFLCPSKGDKPARLSENVILLPQYTAVALASQPDIEFGIVAPSILRSMAINVTANQLRRSLFLPKSLGAISISFIRNAIVAPVATEHYNYQRLESLGDTILKFVTGLQLLDDHPAWHEGYLTRRREHAVSNVKLAHCAIQKHLYNWIVRDRFIIRRWKPDYIQEPTSEEKRSPVEVGPTEPGKRASVLIVPAPESPKGKKKPSKIVPSQLSTKVLADVVESLIGASYIAGGMERSVECIQVLNLGIECKPISTRVASVFKRVEPITDEPVHLTYVESMLGYKFKKRLLLVEALMHASCQSEYRTVSYERLEFLGDSLLDVIVTEDLYHAEGKNYSPGHMHIRKSAMVNVHFLAFICLRTYLVLESQMPRWDAAKGTSIETETRKTYLWQCLMHSSHRILDDQIATFSRCKRGKGEIEQALFHGDTYPWAALTRLQAPKFFSDMIESLLGAVYLDCGGDMQVIRSVLEKLGILSILRRVVSDNVDVRHPVSRVAIWASKRFHEMGKAPKYTFSRHSGLVTCTLTVDNEELASVTERYNGKASQEEVKFRAAETAMKILVARDSDTANETKESR